MDSRLAILVGAFVVAGCGKSSVLTPPPGPLAEHGVWMFLSEDGTGHAVKTSQLRSFSFLEGTYDYVLQGELSRSPLCEGLVETEIRPINLGAGAPVTNVQRLDLGDSEWRPDESVSFSLTPLRRLVPASNPKLALYTTFGLRAADATCDTLVFLGADEAAGVQRLIELDGETRTTTCAPGLRDVSLRDGRLRLLRASGEGSAEELCTKGPIALKPPPGHLSDDGSPDYALSSATQEWFVFGCSDALPGGPRWLETNGNVVEAVTSGGLVECRDQQVDITNPILRAASEEFVATDTEVFARRDNTFTYDATKPLLTTMTCPDCSSIIGMRAYLGGVAVLVSGRDGQRRVAWTDAQGNATPFVAVAETGRVMPHKGFLLGLGVGGLQESLHPGW